MRGYAARILASEGYDVVEAGDGLEALERFQGEAPLPDLVLSDLLMPRLSGVELLSELSRLAPGVPVVLMSGYGTAELEKHGIAAPCAVLSKPFYPDALVAEVRRCLTES